MKTKMIILILVGLINNFTQAQELDVIEAKYNGKPIIRMMLNDQKVWVLLDTGSDFTVLDTTLKDKYGFGIVSSNQSGLKVAGLGSSSNQLSPTYNAKLEFGEVKLKGPIYTIDLSIVGKSIQRRTGKRIAGIIGTKMMSAYGFVIDMRQSTASIVAKSKKAKAPRIYSEESFVVSANFNHNH